MKGSELIAEYLVKQKVPYVFGICGHGNVRVLMVLLCFSSLASEAPSQWHS